ncbi:hypothetical protein HHI36_010922 [Cryptolaemus montrouzieri]|uniref:protein-tyrosine-phosphatase n=1 Tax=Cryptolaemus montrouzieri TaxID=559131 RepID=A0ABD2MK99_9CUCU
MVKEESYFDSDVDAASDSFHRIGGINQVLFSIGKTQGCTSLHYCETLMEDTEYTIVLRGLTRTSYREIFTVVKTGKNSNIGLVLALMCLCLLFIVIGIFLYQSNRKNLWIKFRRISESSIVEEIPRHAISVKHFISYYNKITNDPTLLKKQYEEIEDESKNNRQFVNTTFAMKLENKRKNRYTNIIPFDEHRVKLNIDEDDEISSDYINASFIKGYSGEVEYIATQGPLEHTCKDFWKMVIQENVTVIVMVTQFVEKEKEKCFRYFPNNHETMLISEDIEVKCQVELQFDTYCVRTLLVRKDIRQYTVIHMQFLDWPDFGCPSGTNAMLFFCQEVRDRIQLEQGLMVVHCSAGVGRTGTLISLDILLQSIKNKKRISVFETVVALRRQRTHMVQTEKQYVYIHTCLKDALENATLYLCDDLKTNAEHIYNNIPKKPSELEHGESTF